MRPRVLLLLFVIIAAVAIGWSLVTWRNQPPEIPFTKVMRETIVSSVSTNGKVEPVEWATARADRSGPVGAILIERGKQVQQGDALVEIDSADAKADLAAAQSRIEQARADIAVLDKGGRATDQADITSGIAKAQLDLAAAQRDYDALVRLQAKDAATKFEVSTAKQRVDAAQLLIQSFERKREALVAAPDKSAALARLHDSQAAAALATERIRQSTVRAPISGTVYQFDLKPGAYLNTGDVVASIGKLDRVHVNVYVDEPDLGRVTRGLPVAITWDAMPGRSWKGEVDKTPTQIEALGSRQVGQVICIIENPNRDLLPNTNVTADIRAESAENALTIPREAIRREGGQAGVYALDGNHIVWKKIVMGIGNTTRAQVEGLKEGDSIAMPEDRPLKDGMMVKPVYR